MAFDIHIEGVPVGEIVNERFLQFGAYEDRKVIAVRGIQKMVDRFMKCILTPSGTDISDLEYGTQLANLFLGNLDSAGLRQLVALSVIQAEERIIQYDTVNGAPEEERLSSAVLESLTLQEEDIGSGFEMTVLLQNAAGTTVRVLIPSIG